VNESTRDELLKREEIFIRRRQKSLTKKIGFICTDSHISYHQNEINSSSD